MIKVYKKVLMPIEAWKNFKETQRNLNEELTRLTGKKKSVPMTRVFILKSRQRVTLDNTEVINLAKKRGRGV